MKEEVEAAIENYTGVAATQSVVPPVRVVENRLESRDMTLADKEIWKIVYKIKDKRIRKSTARKSPAIQELWRVLNAKRRRRQPVRHKLRAAARIRANRRAPKKTRDNLEDGAENLFEPEPLRSLSEDVVCENMDCDNYDDENYENEIDENTVMKVGGAENMHEGDKYGYGDENDFDGNNNVSPSKTLVYESDDDTLVVVQQRERLELFGEGSAMEVEPPPSSAMQRGWGSRFGMSKFKPSMIPGPLNRPIPSMIQSNKAPTVGLLRPPSTSTSTFAKAKATAPMMQPMDIQQGGASPEKSTDQAQEEMNDSTLVTNNHQAPGISKQPKEMVAHGSSTALEELEDGDFRM